jgi:putative ABC transport system permease protein
MSAIEIKTFALALGYLLLIIPLCLMLYLGADILKKTSIAVIRMTVQLLFVGLYLHLVFDLNYWWLNTLWLLLMITAADLSIINGTGLKIKRFLAPVFISILAGTTIPLLYFNLVILRIPNLFEAQYFIPIGGMIMGNCLRANIIGIGSFYKSIRENENAYFYSLAQGATLREALSPYFRDAFQAALGPTIATMATVGLVALPGMMTGIIMGGINPAIAIKYQIAIMLAIFTGTSITVFSAIALSIRFVFNDYGIFDHGVFKKFR